MKNLFGIAIFLLLASPALAEEPEVPFLTNQNGIRTTQFESSDDIYIEGICAPANKDSFKIYITYDKIWQVGDNFSDVSGGIETLMGNDNGEIHRTKIWKSPLNQGEYDVAIDANNDFILQDYEQKCVIGIAGTGFRVGNPAPPPSPAPAPTPPPSLPSENTKPSVIFSIDEHVEAGGLANVRKSPGGILVGTQTKGTFGVVIGGPVKAPLGGSNYWFWNINFENDPDGWVAASILKSAPAPASAEEDVFMSYIKEDIATTSPNEETNTAKETTINENELFKLWHNRIFGSRGL